MVFHSMETVFPARAGMIPTLYTVLTAVACIPRESGDDPSRMSSAVMIAMYSPRERG